MSDRFIVSPSLMARMRASNSRATLPMQLAAALPFPNLQTMAVAPGATHVLEYSVELMRDGVVGYWRLADTGQLGYWFPVFYPTGLGSNLLHLWGFIITVTAPYTTGKPGAISTELASRQDYALGIEAGGGGQIVYFPVAGMEEYYEFEGSFTFAASDDFTWELWIKTTQTPGGTVLILEQESGGVYPFRLEMLVDGTVRGSRSDGVDTATVTSSEIVNDGNWHHVIYWKDGVDLAVQIDRNDAAMAVDSVTGDTSLTVDGVLASDGLVADLDELALYRTVLTDEAKLRHWNAALGIAV